MKIVERKVAIAAGVSTYYTGKECKNGHLSYRYTTSGACAECVQSAKIPSRTKINLSERRLALRETEAERRQILRGRRAELLNKEIELREQNKLFRQQRAAQEMRDKEMREASKRAALAEREERMRVALETQAAAKKLEAERTTAKNELTMKLFTVPEIHWSEFRDDLVVLTQAMFPCLSIADISPPNNKKQEARDMGKYQVYIHPAIVDYAKQQEVNMRLRVAHKRPAPTVDGVIYPARVEQLYDAKAKRWLCRLIDTQNDGKLAECDGRMYRLDDLDELRIKSGLCHFKGYAEPFMDPVILPEWMSDDKQREDD